MVSCTSEWYVVHLPLLHTGMWHDIFLIHVLTNLFRSISLYLINTLIFCRVPSWFIARISSSHQLPFRLTRYFPNSYSGISLIYQWIFSGMYNDLVQTEMCITCRYWLICNGYVLWYTITIAKSNVYWRFISPVHPSLKCTLCYSPLLAFSCL
jgi:hypothetical protein